MSQFGQHRTICLDASQVAGGRLTDVKCPEVDEQFAHRFLAEEGTDAPVADSLNSVGPEGGRDR